MKLWLPISASVAAMSVVALVAACGKPAGSRTIRMPSGAEERWNSANDPGLMSLGARGYELKFLALPKAARIKKVPWSDTYWPSNAGGIAARWNSSNPQPFTYASPSLAQLKTMPSNAIAGLSPAEKYDILQGRYNYPTVERERSRTSASEPDWAGLCHGWAPAALLFDEPSSVTLNNPDGIAVPFGSSDVKALLTFYQGEIARSQDTRFLASRCNIDLARNPDAARNAECRDTNAGAFHVVLANKIARGEGFVADVTRDLQVWNQPIFGFETKVLREHGPSSGAAQGTVKEVDVETRMNYTVESQPTWAPFGPNQLLEARTYRYRLELDDAGVILGGEWLTNDRPDFLWSQGRVPFQGYFAGIGDIYAASTGLTPTPNPEPTPSPLPQPNPIPTVLPLPTRTPGAPANSQSFCPAPFALTTVPGTEISYCANAGAVLGPVSEEVVRLCLEGFRDDCLSPTLNETDFVQLRGGNRCMAGTNFDEQTGYCVEHPASGPVSAFGPFTSELVERCERASGGPACRTMRWDRNFLLQLMVR